MTDSLEKQLNDQKQEQNGQTAGRETGQATQPKDLKF